MKILHAYCLNHNIGDYYLGMGVKNILRHYLDIDLIAETNLQGTVFNEYYIDNVINKKYDLLVIGGGGIIHGAHWPNGWFWLIKQELIRRIKIPFIIYAAGYNYFKNEGVIPDIGRSHLLETIERAAYFSVRNDGSLRRLQEQINTTVPVIPDPGFHINLDRKYKCEETGPFVLMQLANDKPEHRFTGSGGRDKFIAKLSTVTQKLSKRYKIILAPHVYEDVELSQQVVQGVENAVVWNFSTYAFDRAIESVGYYQNAKFVIAMRGHGQIVPIAFNTPVISLENHPKHVGLMQELGIEQYNVSLSNPDFDSLLVEKINHLEKNEQQYRSHLAKKNLYIAEQTRAALQKIKSAIMK